MSLLASWAAIGSSSIAAQWALKSILNASNALASNVCSSNHSNTSSLDSLISIFCKQLSKTALRCSLDAAVMIGILSAGNCTCHDSGRAATISSLTALLAILSMHILQNNKRLPSSPSSYTDSDHVTQ